MFIVVLYNSLCVIIMCSDRVGHYIAMFLFSVVFLNLHVLEFKFIFYGHRLKIFDKSFTREYILIFR